MTDTTDTLEGIPFRSLTFHGGKPLILFEQITPSIRAYHQGERINFDVMVLWSTSVPTPSERFEDLDVETVLTGRGCFDGILHLQWGDGGGDSGYVYYPQWYALEAIMAKMRTIEDLYMCDPKTIGTRDEKPIFFNLTRRG